LQGNTQTCEHCNIGWPNCKTELAKRKPPVIIGKKESQEGGRKPGSLGSRQVADDISRLKYNSYTAQKKGPGSGKHWAVKSSSLSLVSNIGEILRLKKRKPGEAWPRLSEKGRFEEGKWIVLVDCKIVQVKEILNA